MRKVLYCLVSFLCVASLSSIAVAQRDFEVDPVHYKVEFENDCVYVARANFGPHEKMPSFFDAKPAVIVSLTDSQGLKLTYPDGRSRVTSAWRAGAVYWASATERIQQENVGDTRHEFIIIQPKGCN
jgi:hypothetical protein